MKTHRSSSSVASKSVKSGSSPLVRSAASARREKAVLRRGRELLEDQTDAARDSVRGEIVVRRMPKR